MKFLNGGYYVEVKGHRYKIQPIQNNKLRLRDSPKSMRTQNQVQNEPQIRKKRKVIMNDKIDLELKSFPKTKQLIIHQPKLKLPNCPCCKRNNW